MSRAAMERALAHLVEGEAYGSTPFSWAAKKELQEALAHYPERGHKAKMQNMKPVRHTQQPMR